MADAESVEVTAIGEITKSDELNVSKCVLGNVFNLILRHGRICPKLIVNHLCCESKHLCFLCLHINIFYYCH